MSVASARGCNPLPNAPGALRRPEPGLFHGLGDRPDHWPFEWRCGQRAQSRALPTPYGGHDAGTAGFPTSGFQIAQTDVVRSGALQAAPDMGVRQEDNGLDEGNLRFAQGSLNRQQAFQPLALAVEQKHRVVDRVATSLVLPDPGLLVAGDRAWATLDFHQKCSVRTDHEQVDLVNRSVIGEELEQRPGQAIILARETLEDEVECLLLPWEARRANRLPVFFRHGTSHSLTLTRPVLPLWFVCVSGLQQ